MYKLDSKFDMHTQTNMKANLEYLIRYATTLSAKSINLTI